MHMSRQAAPTAFSPSQGKLKLLVAVTASTQRQRTGSGHTAFEQSMLAVTAASVNC